jgi:hypothetical protein
MTSSVTMSLNSKINDMRKEIKSLKERLDSQRKLLLILLDVVERLDADALREVSEQYDNQ